MTIRERPHSFLESKAGVRGQVAEGNMGGSESVVTRDGNGSSWKDISLAVHCFSKNLKELEKRERKTFTLYLCNHHPFNNLDVQSNPLPLFDPRPKCRRNVDLAPLLNLAIVDCVALPMLVAFLQRTRGNLHRKSRSTTLITIVYVTL